MIHNDLFFSITHNCNPTFSFKYRCASNEALNRTRNSDLGPTFNTSRFDPYKDRWPRCIPRVCMEKFVWKEKEKISDDPEKWTEEVLKTYFEVSKPLDIIRIIDHYEMTPKPIIYELSNIYVNLIFQHHESSSGTCNCKFDKCSEFIFDTVGKPSMN